MAKMSLRAECGIAAKIACVNIFALMAAMAFMCSTTECFAETAPVALLPTGSSGTVSLNDFGAVPGSGEDATEAMHKAIEFCKLNGVRTLTLPKGRYDFHEGKGQLYEASHWAAPISGCKGLVIDGQGSELIFHGLQFAFQCRNSEDITLKNFSIDYERPFFSAGWVMEVDPEGRSFEIEVDPKYPVKGGEPVEAFLQVDPDTGMAVYRGLNVYYRVKSTELLASQRLRVNLTEPIAKVKPGMFFVLRHLLYTAQSICLLHSKDVKIENVSIYAGSGMAIIGQYLENLSVKGLRVVRKPESGRFMSTASDGLNLLECKGAIHIEDCEFNGMGDDCINVFSNFWTAKRKIDASTLEIYDERMNSRETPQEVKGDVMELYRSETLERYGRMTIKRIEPNFKTHSAIVEFEEPLPERFLVGRDFLMRERGISALTIKNSKFSALHGRGVVIQVPNARVENCLFQNISSCGVNVTTCVAPWFEGGPTSNVKIVNNKFINCFYGGPDKNSAVLQVSAILRDKKDVSDLCTVGEFAKSGVHRDLEISGNLIQRSNNGGLAMNGVEKAVVKDNVFEDVSMDPCPTWASNLKWSENVLTLSGVKDLDFRKNVCRYSSDPERLGRVLIVDAAGRKDMDFNDNQGFDDDEVNGKGFGLGSVGRFFGSFW